MTTPYRVVVVDDEPLAREGLRDAVARLSGTGELPAFDVVELSENGIAGLEAIQRTEPDVLLLDVAMPVLDGFAMLERLEPETTPPAVILVTAYDEHAVRAFEAEALDFLVKPVPDARLRGALGRAARRIVETRALRAELETPPSAAAAREQYLRQLVIPDRGRQLVVPTEEIEWIEADTYYVRIHANGRPRLLRERLSVLERSLDPAHFYRTHRSAIVRIDLVRELRPESPYAHSVLLATGARVPVSRERLKGLTQILG